MSDKIFDENSLREAIVSVWGEYGAHAEVYDMLLKKLNELQTPPPDAAVREAAFREGYELGNDDGRNIDVFCHIKQHNPENDPDFAWEHSNARRAAFPEAFAGEVGNE